MRDVIEPMDERYAARRWARRLRVATDELEAALADDRQRDVAAYRIAVAVLRELLAEDLRRL